jgi:hypothetical protein
VITGASLSTLITIQSNGSYLNLGLKLDNLSAHGWSKMQMILCHLSIFYIS